MAAFGIVQYLTSNEKFFWVYEHPFAVTSDGAKGAFTNRNHFAHFLAMGLGPVVWWVQNSLRRGRREHAGFQTASTPSRVGDFGAGARLIALGVLIFGILLSLSRGGAIAGGLAAAASIAVCYRAGSLRGRFALGLAAVALLLAASLSIVGHDRVTERLEGLASGSWDEVDRSEGRRTIWKTTLAAIPDFRWAGSGIGSFREVYPMYLQGRGNAEYYTHAENGYLQVALETGLAGALLMGLAIAVCGYWSVAALRGATSTRMFVAAGAAASVLLVSVVHSAVDFVWYAPGCLVIAVIMAACACRLRQFTRGAECRLRDRFVLPRAAAWLSAAAAAGLGVWLVASQFGPLWAESHWLSYERAEPRAAYLQSAMKPAADEDLLPEDPAAGGRRGGAEAARKAAEMEVEQRMAAELLETVRWNPRHARPPCLGGELHARCFISPRKRPSTACRSARFAMRRSRPATAAGRAERVARQGGWEHYVYLDRALDHTRQSLDLCPLLGEGYLYLGELCFRKGPRGGQIGLRAAARRPPPRRHGPVSRGAGGLAGRPARRGIGLLESCRLRSRADLSAPGDRLMAGRTAEVALRQEIGFFLEQFQPNLDALQYMYHRYRRIATPEQLRRCWPSTPSRAQGKPAATPSALAREQAWRNGGCKRWRRWWTWGKHERRSPAPCGRPSPIPTISRPLQGGLPAGGCRAARRFGGAPGVVRALQARPPAGQAPPGRGQEEDSRPPGFERPHTSDPGYSRGRLPQHTPPRAGAEHAAGNPRAGRGDRPADDGLPTLRGFRSERDSIERTSHSSRGWRRGSLLEVDRPLRQADAVACAARAGNSRPLADLRRHVLCKPLPALRGAARAARNVAVLVGRRGGRPHQARRFRLVRTVARMGAVRHVRRRHHARRSRHREHRADGPGRTAVPRQPAHAPGRLPA